MNARTIAASVALIGAISLSLLLTSGTAGISEHLDRCAGTCAAEKL